MWTISTPVSGGTAWQLPTGDAVPVVTAPSGLEMTTDWGLLALIGLASLNALVLLLVVWRVGRLVHRLNGILRRVEGGTEPVVERVASIAGNVDHITQSVRGDVRYLTSSVRALSDRLTQASEHMETRIDEFNALLEVVQSEAEEVFLNTASAVRGVRAGAHALDPGREAGHAAPASKNLAATGEEVEPLDTPGQPAGKSPA